MGPHLTAQQRAAILADIKAGTKSRNQIARDHGVAAGTVTNIARQAGATDAFDRAATEAATRARVIDCKAAREQLKQDLIGDAQRLRDRAWSPYQVVVGTPKGAQTVSLDLPPLADTRAAYTAIGMAVDRHLRLEQHDAHDSAADARSMLGSLSEALGVAARHLDAGTEDPA